MGAEVKRKAATAVIQGVARLTGAPVMASDLAPRRIGFGGTEAEELCESSTRLSHRSWLRHLDDKLSEIGRAHARVKAEIFGEQPFGCGASGHLAR